MLDSILYSFLLFSLIFIVVTVFFTTAALCWVLSLTVQIIARLCRARVTRRFDDYGATFACENLHKRSRMNILFHLVCEGTITIDQLRSQVEANLLSWTDDPEKRLKFWRLKERWTTFLGFLFWEPIPDFNVSDHVRLYGYSEPDLRLPSVVTEEDLKRISGSYLGHPYVKGCPWELLLIPNYLRKIPDGSRS